MSTFDYAGSQQLAYNLVEKFGTDCKVASGGRTRTMKVVFVGSTKGEKADSMTRQPTKQVYLTGWDVDIQINDRLTIRNDTYLITAVESYNFDNAGRILFIATLSK